jgi:hypothetical protein
MRRVESTYHNARPEARVSHLGCGLIAITAVASAAIIAYGALLLIRDRGPAKIVMGAGLGGVGLALTSLLVHAATHQRAPRPPSLLRSALVNQRPVAPAALSPLSNEDSSPISPPSDAEDAEVQEIAARSLAEPATTRQALAGQWDEVIVELTESLASLLEMRGESPKLEATIIKSRATLQKMLDGRSALARLGPWTHESPPEKGQPGGASPRKDRSPPRSDTHRIRRIYFDLMHTQGHLTVQQLEKAIISPDPGAKL